MSDINSNKYDINILVVDDNPKNIAAMKNILSELPITIFTATSGQEALQIVLRHSFALIYLDVQMPEMDGYEVARLLTQNNTTGSTPIVFVTANSTESRNVQQGYESGAVDYLTKPIDSSIVLAKSKIFIKMYEQQQELTQLVEQLHTLANEDVLTGLANRHQFNSYFANMLENCKRYKREFALLLLDLDNFKIINDTYGHDIGDLLLKQMADRIVKVLRQSDHVSRLGGDEFVVLTEIKASGDASVIAKNILHAMSEPFDLDGSLMNVTTSIGIANYPFAGDTVQSLFKTADIALYRAKEKGKNAIEYYDKSLNEAYIYKGKMGQQLREAIKNNEIELYYQPRVNMKTNKIIGLEALARWNNKELGSISPLEFISVAEERGFIIELGECLMSSAFKQFEQWQTLYPKINFSLAINLSPHQFINKLFLSSLKGFVSQYNIELSRIEFELTESVFEGYDEELEKLLQQICDLGIQFSIDDFGTGYSSLSRLKLLPIRVLKIDQSFVRDITTDKEDAAIVKAIIALAKALQLGVVAEGVEEKEQMEFLINNGCVEGQGFYFSKPLPVDEIEQLLSAQ